MTDTERFEKYRIKFSEWLTAKSRKWSFQEVKWRIDEIVAITREDPEDYQSLKKARSHLVFLCTELFF